MCAPSRLQQHIRNLTNDGEVVARFLVDTVQAKTPGVKPCHQMEATKHLIRFGFTDEEQSQFWGLIPTPEELAEKNRAENPPLPQGEGWGEGDSPVRPEPVEGRVRNTENSKLTTVNSLDILNYDIAHLIRQETADGHTIAEFLSDVMTRRDKPFTPKKLRIRHTDRMAAAREILRRGFGHFGTKRKLVVDASDGNNHDTNDYDTLHTDLAKRMREYSEHGTDAVRFLLDVMEDTNPDEPYTWHHRMSAAMELLRRGWDTNYDRITPEMLQDYWRDQQSPRLSVAQKKRLAGLPATLDDHNTYDNEDYQSIADAIREQEDREAISPIENSPLSLRERVRVRVKSPAQTQSQNTAATPSKQTNPPHPVSYPDPDDTPDCYHEPLNPEQQAIFDYHTQIESGEYKEGEITLRQPTPEDWRAYELDLAHITELAETEGVPLLPNPLADNLKMPNIRSP